jgi:NAD(P)H dehydrogenase (quinone)
MSRLAHKHAAKRALVVMAHPSGTSLTRSVSNAILNALTAHGIESKLADLAAEGFDPVFGPSDRAAFTGDGPPPDDVRSEQQRIDGVDHLVLVYPVYWWSMPALLKGWIDRVFISGWAFDADAEHGLIKKLGHLKVHLISLGGADAATYAKRGYSRAMQAQIDQGIFGYCGATVTTSELFTADQADSAPIPASAAQAIVMGLP